MPSRRSPSQRTPEGRQGRQMAALTIGANAGRLISASQTRPQATRPAASPAEITAPTNPGIALDTVIKQGPAGIASNVFPSGTRIPMDCSTSGWYLRCNPSHMPSGSPCTIAVKRSGTTIATVSIAAGSSSGSATTIVALLTGDILTYDITSVGSTTPAWDVALMLVGG